MASYLNKLKQLFDEFIFGNFFIAFCALALVYSTCILNNLNLYLTPYAVFVFFSTYLFYNFHTYSFQLIFSSLKAFKKSINAIKISTFRLLTNGLALLICTYQLFFFKESIFIFLLPCAIVTFAYSIPVIGKNNKKKFRDYYLLKLPLLSFVWAFSTVIIPLAEQNIDLLSPFVVKQMLCRFLFMFALCVPFEIRDMEIDKLYKVKTFPIVLGRSFTIKTGIIFLLLEILLHHSMDLSSKIIVALDLSSVIAITWIIILKKQRGEYFYKLFVDGTMVIRFIFLYLAFTL